MTETILKMLEDKESDNDELNARLWCFENEFDPGVWVSYTNKSDDEDFLKYTTSLDAAMSIGKEELDGKLIMFWCEDDGLGTFSCGYYWDESVDRPIGRIGGQAHDLPRAICHARIQALDYVRKEKADENKTN